jgi:hypothetical protein
MNSLFTSGSEIALFSDNTIEFKGRKFTPDFTKGYVQFSMSHAFPVRTVYKTALHPAVIATSYASLENQNVNREHQIRSYFKKPGENTSVMDHIIGSVVAVDFTPGASLLVNKDTSKVPSISAVAALFKQADGMQRIIGEHQASRHKYTVSMEVDYDIEQSGFAVALNGSGKPKFDFTPSDMLAAGYEYIPWASAPNELRATFSQEKQRVTKDWLRRDVTLLLGGLNSPVHYAGVAIVKYGAEPTANIKRLSASDSTNVYAPFEQLADFLKNLLTKSGNNKQSVP